MSTKVKSKKKKKKNLSSQNEPTVKGQWCWGKRAGLAKLLKVLGSNSKSSTTQQAPAAWLVNSDVSQETKALVTSWHSSVINKSNLKQLASEVINSIDAIIAKFGQTDIGVVVLAACHSLRAIAGSCEYSQWQDLVSRILELAQSAELNTELPPHVFQQLAIEVPLTVAFQIPDPDSNDLLAKRSCKKLDSSIVEMLDHDGWPNATYLPQFGPLVASWVRCYAIIDELNLEPGFESASQLEWMVRQVLRMLRPDGRLVFSDSVSNPVTNEFLHSLLKLSNDPEDKRLLKIVSLNSKSTYKAVDLPEPGCHSEWSETALLQSAWGPTPPKVAIDFSRGRCLTEICRDATLIKGESLPAISVNGVAVQNNEAFEIVCIESDEDVEYLELERELGNGVRFTRQYLLSRNEEFLMIADLVMTESSSRIDYQCQWPLAPGIEGLHESETREVYLTGKKIQSLVLPLALPEWKVGRTDDRLEFKDRRLCLTQSTNGCGLYAPLFFDLNAKRSKKKRTWRQLTVAENREKVGHDQACAFRVQLDKNQWLLYRTVSSKGNRTFMGENVTSEFVFSRFSKDGTVTQLIEIE